MKKRVLFLFLLFVSVHSVFAQVDNPCGFHWGDWMPTPLQGPGGVSYAVQYAKCTPNGICGWPKIALRHSFPDDASISVTLKGTDCDNKVRISNFSTGGNKIAARLDYKSDGNWHLFRVVNQVVKVEVSYVVGNDHYVYKYDAETGLTKMTINGRSKTEIDQQLQDKKTEYRKRLDDLEKSHLAIMSPAKQLTNADQSGIKSQDKNFYERKTAVSNLLSRNYYQQPLSDTELQQIEDDLDVMGSINTELTSDIETLKTHDQSLAKSKRDSVSSSRKNQSSISTGNTGYYVESEESRKARLRYERIHNVQAKDAQEKATSDAITSSVASTLTNDQLNNERMEGRTTYFRGNVAVAGYNLPAVSNSSDGGKVKYSSLDSHFNYGGQVQLDAWLYNNDRLGFLLQPLFYYGINVGAGANGSQTIYGGNARFQYGKGVKIFVEAGYYNRTGDETRDLDATAASYGISTGSDISTTINYSYNVMRYGGGIIIGPMNKDLSGRDLGLKLGVFSETVDYNNYNGLKQSPLVYQLQWTVDGGFYLGAEYSSGYPFANTASYAIDELKKGSYYGVTLGKTFNLSKSKY